MMHWIKSIHQASVSKLRGLFRWILQKLRTVKLARPHTSQGEAVKIVPPESLKPAVAELRSSHQQYFVEARSWTDDLYTAAIISRNRYKLAFLIAISLAILLTIAVDGLIPMQHMEPLLVNHYQDGRVSVQPIKQPAAPTHQVQVESDLVRYIINRESYDAIAYPTQYALVHLLSNRQVAKQYIQKQSTRNRHAPINVLGNSGWRTVHVDSVVFLDSKRNNIGKPPSQQTHHNLAQVNFAVTDHVKNSGLRKTKALTALMSWTYRGTPSDPGDVWRDWNGFTVTRYTVAQRNVSY